MGDGGAALKEEEEEEALEGMEEDALDEDGDAVEDTGRWWCGRWCGRGWDVAASVGGRRVRWCTGSTGAPAR